MSVYAKCDYPGCERTIECYPDSGGCLNIEFDGWGDDFGGEWCEEHIPPRQPVTPGFDPPAEYVSGLLALACPPIYAEAIKAAFNHRPEATTGE